MTSHPKKQRIWWAYLAMMCCVGASNYLVMFPINDWLTWGSFSYPSSFLVNELTNRFYGPKAARKVVYRGFWLGVLLSFLWATPQIALASGGAFLISQLLDIAVFVRLRQGAWWYAPFCASLAASAIDTSIFWTIAFWGMSYEAIAMLAIGDFGIKVLMDLFFLLPFRLFLYSKLKPTNQAA